MTWTGHNAKALSDVFEALNDSGLEWMILRNHQGLPEVNGSKDIDLGVAPRNFKRAEAIVTQTLARFGYRYKVTSVFQWARCSSYFAIENGVVESIKIDLMDGYSWRAANIYNFDKLYARRVSYKHYSVPDHVDAAVIAWIKPLMTGGFVKKAYVAEISNAIGGRPEQFRQSVVRILGAALTERIWPLLLDRRFEDVVPLRRTICLRAWWRTFRMSPLHTLVRLAKYVGLELLRRSRRPRGSLLAFVGPDGVGKTTLINELRPRLASLLAKDPSSVVVRHFRPHVLPNIKSLLRVGAKPTEEEFSRPHRAQSAGALSSVLRLAYYWLDYVIGYWLVVRRECVAGRVTLFDRYCYDFIVDPRRSRLGLPLWIRRTFCALIPQPDLVIFLDCEARVAHERKRELSLEETERQLAAYRELVVAAPGRFILLDACAAPVANVGVVLTDYVTRVFAHGAAGSA